MAETQSDRERISSGVQDLDTLLEGLHVGDNVVWYDHAGSLAPVFCHHFLEASRQAGEPLVYVSFDRSPRNLLDQLGALAEYPGLTILDCFTWGKGAGSDVFLNFYYESAADRPCRIVRVDEPRNRDHVIDALYGVHSSLDGCVRFVFESLTGMQELWGGEESIASFYGHSCPRLYELNTVAYWLMEKDAHSQRVRAQINQIAQVVIELSVRRGRTSLSIVKAEKRSEANLHRSFTYWTKDRQITFEKGKRSAGQLELGSRLRDIRAMRGVSQTELAKLVGVTPSTISQIESNLIYPSLPGLIKMAEVLSVDVGSFLQEKENGDKPFIFSGADAVEVKLPDLPEGAVVAKLLTPFRFDVQADPYIIEIPPKTEVPGHFFVHKGEEMGYVIAGKLEVFVDDTYHTARTGDLIYLTKRLPGKWRNPGPGAARILWIKLK